MNKAKKLGLLVASVTLAGVSGAAGMNIVNTHITTVHAEETAEKNDSNEITLGTSTTDDISLEDDTSSQDDGYLPNVKAITQQVMPAIVAITAESKETIEFWGRSYEQDSESAGSGVIIAKSDDELMIATNNHVVEDADDLTVLFSVDTEDEDDALVPALVKGTDSSLDLAVVAVKLEDIPDEVLDQIAIAELGDSSDLQVGDWSIAIGNALGYGQSVTFGIVSALEREVTLSTNNGDISQTMIQTDAAINFGNSGGALLNAQGQLIGINSAKASSTGVEGMGYAIPINTAKPVLEELMNQATRIKVDDAKAGVLGIQITNVSQEARQLYSIPAGAYVYTVTEDSAADEAGLEAGDIITKLDKTTISSTAELQERLAYYEAGEDVDVTVKRPSDNGYTEMTITVTLQAKTDSVSSATTQEEQEYDEYEENDDSNDIFFNEAPSNNSRDNRDMTNFGFFW